MASRPTIAIVGLGMGKGHATVAAENPKVELAALCDIDPERLALHCKRLNVRNGFTDYRKMLHEAKPDMVVVALPNVLHKPVTIAGTLPYHDIGPSGCDICP